ncbi:hypothetical protein ADUPG1_001416 [Aduncisulcus paluster]|uniref:Uncharacterized protein n=2 Tax=Aduncisulcus paluster TaxID=2918883 RepID=A0ABQ5KFZ5_9EUKA|nr:hypothetical protein ADUPG1_001416 [Aduncisulcus paluster]
MTGYDIPYTVFCDETPSYGYVMGRKQKTGVLCDCATTPEEISLRLRMFLNDELKAGMTSKIPAAVNGIKIDPSKPLTLAQWREKIGGQVFKDVDRRFKDNFKDPASYANKGPNESEGQKYARAVIVPPVAIAFSLFLLF